MTVLHGSDSDSGVILDGFPNSVKCVFVVVFVEETEEAPDTSPGAVVVFRFDVYSSLLDFGISAGCFPEMGFRMYVSI